MKVLSNLKGDKLDILLDQAIYSGTSFLSGVLLARVLGIANFGLFMAIVLVCHLLVSMANAVTINISMTLLPGIHEKDAYRGFVLLLQLFIVVIFVFLLFVISYIPLEAMEEVMCHSFSSYVYITFMLLFDFFRKSLIIERSFKKLIRAEVVFCILQLSILLFLLIGEIDQLQTVILWLSLPLFVSTAMMIQVQSRVFNWSNRYLAYLKTHIREGKWLLYTSALQWWSSNLFVLSSGVVLGAGALGAFRLVQSLFGVINIFLQAFENYVLPLASEKLLNSVESSQVFIKDISKKTLVLLGSVLVVVILSSKWIILLLGGAEFADYAFLIRAMGLLYFIVLFGYPVRIAVRMLSFNRAFFAGYVITFLFSLASFSFFLNGFGLWGVVIGLMINQLISQLFWQYILNKNKYFVWK